jgi:flagellar biosynthesis protein FliQ
MELAQVIDGSREALRMALILGGPPLAAALVVGLLMGVAQTLTQLHEPVLAFVPRLLAVGVVVLAVLPWFLSRWVAFAAALIGSIPDRL